MQSTADKLLRENAGGPFVVRPKIITDGLTSYVDAVGDVFGSYADHGVYKKRYQTKGKDGQTLQRKRCVGADRIVQSGEIDETDIHTAFVERQNLNVRMKNRRFGRRTNAFSKSAEHHERRSSIRTTASCRLRSARPTRRASLSKTRRATLCRGSSA